MRVLVVEDDRKVASFVVQGLHEAGFAVDQTADGVAGLHLACTTPYDVAVIDIMIPTLDGLSLSPSKVLLFFGNFVPLARRRDPVKEGQGCRWHWGKYSNRLWNSARSV
jgi:Response regulator receiver domain